MINKITIFLIMLMALSNQFCISQNTLKKVSLSGLIKNFNNEVTIEDMSELQTFNVPESELHFLPDSNGRFAISFQLKKGNYFRIGRNILFLIPGDSLYIELDFRKPENAFFKGSNANVNYFLVNTPYPKGGSFLSSGDNIKATIKATIDTILKIAEKRESLLNSYTNISNQFRVLEVARIRADILNSISLLYTYYVYKHKIKNDSLKYYANSCNAIKESYFRKSSLTFLNPHFLQLAVYRNIIEGLLFYTKKNQKIPIAIKEYLILEKFSEKSTKITEKDSLQNIKKEISTIANSAYKMALLKKINTLLKFGNGSTAKSFEAQQLNGKKVYLSNFKNKIIYIDIWATWCGPCKEQMPAFELLKEKYKQNSNIVFISLSIDDDEDLWKKDVSGRNANGEQWLINRTKLNAYNIATIPRAILIDKNFKVFQMQAALPDSKKIDETINSLLAESLK